MYGALYAVEEAGTVERSEETFKDIKVLFYTGSGSGAHTYKLHWFGAQHYFQNINQPRKLLFTGPAHLERPFNAFHDETLFVGTTIGLVEKTTASWMSRWSGTGDGANERANRRDWPPRKHDGPNTICSAGSGCRPRLRARI